ncbi:MAG: GAF domain-containing sensor histidine kinase [Anaerolineaceae bacterium]|nr:GAF domain-containing sensor histidine kinase [Anaerolineaceae bacterium]
MKTISIQSIRQERLESFNQDCLDLFKDLSVDSLISRILYIAATWTNSCYCVCGLSSAKRGRFSSYKLYGFTPSEIKLLNAGQKDAILSIPSDEIICTESQEECQKYHIFNSRDNDNFSLVPIIHSILYVPIFFNEDKIGSITLMNKIGAASFTTDDVRLIDSLSDYSGIAINNARLYSQSAIREKKLAKSNDDLALLNELGRIFADNNGSIQALAEDMLNLIIANLGLETGEIFLNSDEKPDEYNLIVQQGHNDLPNSLLGLNTVSLGEGLLGTCAAKNESYLMKPAQLEAINAKVQMRSKLNYMIILPIPTHSEVLGLMILGGHFAKGEEEPDRSMLTSIAAWIAPLIENLRLVQQKQKIAILEERDRIGMDLHDGVIQSIYGVGLMLENARLTAEKSPEKTAESIHAATEALNATIRDIRSYIMNLKPDKLTSENLVQSMRRLANDFHANTLIPASFNAKVEHVESLSAEKNNPFYLICKEGLANVAKHAHAKSVTVNFMEMKDRFVLMIIDDGIGFDTEKERKSTSHGVTNMFARTRSLGGDIDITSIRNRGTTIVAWLPLNNADEAK